MVKTYCGVDNTGSRRGMIEFLVWGSDHAPNSSSLARPADDPAWSFAPRRSDVHWNLASKFHELRKANRIPPPKVLGCIAFTFSPHARAKGGAALSISLRRSFTLSILPSDVSGSSVTICTNFGA